MSTRIAKDAKGLQSILNQPRILEGLQQAATEHLTPARLVRIAITAAMKTPKLLECSPESFLAALTTCSQLGLEPDGRLIHLIPYRNNRAGRTDCQVIIDYKGMVELARRSGLVSELGAEIICENDHFEYQVGHLPVHKIDFFSDRGKMVGAWAYARMKSGDIQPEVMTKDEIDQIRKRSKSSGSGPWVTDYNEMAKKTAFRRLAKWLPQSPEFRDAVALDDKMQRVANETSMEVAQETLADSIPNDPAKTLEDRLEAEDGVTDVNVDEPPPTEEPVDAYPEDLTDEEKRQIEEAEAAEALAAEEVTAG